MAMNEERKALTSDILEWFGILAGPVAWLTQFLINYALVRLECIRHSQIGLRLVSGIFLAVVISGGIVSAIYFTKTREQSAASEKLSARRHFMAAMGIFSATLYSLAIVMQGVATFIWDPCQK
jgi:hypothetical protein